MRRLLPILCVVLHAFPLKADTSLALADSAKAELPIYIRGQFTTTNKGVSLFPAFSLGRPATMLEMKIGGRFHVDPELRYATDGTPWSYIAWMRYEWLNTSTFNLRVGGHASVLFSKKEITWPSGMVEERILGNRFLAAEIAPTWKFGSRASAGLYYLHSRGLDPGSISFAHFAVAHGRLAGMKVGKKATLEFRPQVYYLQMDQNWGIYACGTVQMDIRNSPWALQTIVNQPVVSHIPNGNTLLYNFSLLYKFNQEYLPYRPIIAI
jgi:hypothetical protein